MEFLPCTGLRHRSWDTHHLTGLGTTGTIPMKFGFKCFSFVVLSPAPPHLLLQTVSEATTSKQPCIQLWGKNLSVKSGKDWSLELHSTQCIAAKLLLSYFSIRGSGQWLPWSLIDIWVLLRLLSLQVATACSFYSADRKQQQGTRRPQAPLLSSSGWQQQGDAWSRAVWHTSYAGSVPAKVFSELVCIIPVKDSKHNKSLHLSFST